MDLSDRTCVACEGGVPPLTEAEYAPLLAQLPGWSVERDKRLVRSFRFPSYPTTIAFVNAVASIAEVEGHHPNLTVAWGKVGITLWTHTIDGLSKNDFILAAKIERILPDGADANR